MLPATVIKCFTLTKRISSWTKAQLRQIHQPPSLVMVLCLMLALGQNTDSAGKNGTNHIRVGIVLVFTTTTSADTYAAAAAAAAATAAAACAHVDVAVATHCTMK
uniref:Uncharacterized protein n=1 Tax=Glossina austeni TaxID=7395 RepID=A0A1A9UG96_GLOAU